MLIFSYYSWQFIRIIFQLENQGVMTTPKRRSILPTLIFACKSEFLIQMHVSTRDKCTNLQYNIHTITCRKLLNFKMRQYTEP